MKINTTVFTTTPNILLQVGTYYNILYYKYIHIRLTNLLEYIVLVVDRARADVDGLWHVLAVDVEHIAVVVLDWSVVRVRADTLAGFVH